MRPIHTQVSWAATTGIGAVIDFPHIVIGGAVPETVLDEIVRRTADAYEMLNTQGITQPTFSRGTAGPNARALGASLLPISKSFLLETTEFDLRCEHRMQTKPTPFAPCD